MNKPMMDHRSPRGVGGLANSFAIDERTCIDIVQRIQVEDPTGVEQLYQCCSRPIQLLLCRLLNAEDVEDCLHDALIAVTLEIQRGRLRDPTRLLAYVLTISRRFAIATIRKRIRRRQYESQNTLIGEFTTHLDRASSSNPEDAYIQKQHLRNVHGALQQLSEHDRNILYKFYILEQSPEQIQNDMRLTATQFRLRKWRAKERFGSLSRTLAGTLPKAAANRPARTMSRQKLNGHIASSNAPRHPEHCDLHCPGVLNPCEVSPNSAKSPAGASF